MNKRYATALILALICVFAYALSQGWLGPATPSIIVEDFKVSVSRPLDEPSANELVALDVEGDQ